MPTVTPNREFNASNWPEAAADIQTHLSEYTKPRAPAQPAGLPQIGTLAALLEKARERNEKGARRLTDQEADIVDTFAAWRERVFLVEAASAATLSVLLSLVRHLEPNGEITDASLVVRQHCHQQGWGWPPKVVDESALKWLPEYRAQDPVLGSEMRNL